MKYILRATLFFVLTQFFIEVNSQGMEYALIEDYLKVNNLKTCVLLSCNKTQDYLNLIKTFRSKSDIWYRLWDVSNDVNEFETLLIRLSHQVGVVIDLNCSEIVEFFREISKRIYFHHERYWLLFSMDLNQTFNVLQKQNINVDAEISIAIPKQDDEKKYIFLIKLLYLLTF